MTSEETEQLRRKVAELEAEVARLRRHPTAAPAVGHGSADAAGAINERYRLAARATNDAVWDWDLRHNTVEWNEALQVAYGHAPADVEPTGDWWIANIHPDDRDAVSESIHAVIDGTGTNWTGEYRFRKADGDYAEVLDRGFVIREPAGQAIRMIGAMLDLSARKRAERALREADDRLRVAMTAAGVGTFDYWVRSGALTWDARCRALFGVPPGQPVSYEDTFLPGLHPDDRDRADAAVRRALDPSGPGTFGLEYRTVGLSDGVLRWVAASGEASFEAGEAVRLIGTVLDISDRKRAEQALHRLNLSLEAQVAERTQERDGLWNASQDLLGVATGEGVWVGVNPAWTTLLGWRADEIVGRTSEWLEHPDDRASTRSEVAELAGGQRTVNFENRFRTRAGEYRTLSWVAVRMEGLLYCSARDVTAQKEAAETLARTQEALRQSQKMEAVGQLTGGIAHDFNNLLTGIIGSLELLNTRVAQGRLGDVERYVTAAQGAARRAAALTHRLLAFSRRQTLDPRPTDVNRLATGMEDLVRRTVGPAITVEMVAAAGLWPTLVDANQLENALLNLCINARDAMPGGGRLTIETANRWLDMRAARERELPPGQYVSLCVSDNGTGMPPEVVAKAFDPFFTTKPMGMGTGLGLSMIYGFARQSGGQIRLYSEVGQGTLACLYLPRFHGEAEPGDAAPEPASEPPAGRGETVLVVDDEPTVRMLVMEILEELGYAAIEAADGASGLKVLQSNARIDLLVTDVGLPGGMNGRQMADAGRVGRPELKVLFITGYAENAVVGNGYLEPGMHVMTKPFPMEALAARIRDLINEG